MNKYGLFLSFSLARVHRRAIISATSRKSESREREREREREGEGVSQGLKIGSRITLTMSPPRHPRLYVPMKTIQLARATTGSRGPTDDEISSSIVSRDSYRRVAASRKICACFIGPMKCVNLICRGRVRINMHRAALLAASSCEADLCAITHLSERHRRISLTIPGQRFSNCPA